VYKSACVYVYVCVCAFGNLYTPMSVKLARLYP
jgi:hypothetical protein